MTAGVAAWFKPWRRRRYVYGLLSECRSDDSNDQQKWFHRRAPSPTNTEFALIKMLGKDVMRPVRGLSFEQERPLVLGLQSWTSRLCAAMRRPT